MKQIRASYKVIKGKYKRLGKKNVRLTQSSLQLIRDIDPTTSTYTFPVLESEGAPFAAETRLNINDELISYDVGYYVRAEYEVAAVLVSNMYFTYAPTELASTFGQLQNAWNGNLSIAVNKISRLENWDMKKHNFVPRTQFVVAAPALGIISAAQPSFDFSKDGNIPMQPMLTFSGAKKNDVTLSLDLAISAISGAPWTSADSVAADITATQLAFFFRGMLAQNAAVFQGRAGDEARPTRRRRRRG